MTTYVQQLAKARSPIEKACAERLVVEFETNAVVVDGIVRWISNNQVPPQDVLDLWVYCGKSFDPVRSAEVRAAETKAFLSEYRDFHANRLRTPEERCESRAEHGAGVTLINVVTARRFKT